MPQQFGSPNCQKHHTTANLPACLAVKEAYTPKSWWTAVWERDISSSRKRISKTMHPCSLERYIDRIIKPSGLVASNIGSETDPLSHVGQCCNFIMNFSCGKGEKRRQKKPKFFGPVRAGAVCTLIIKVFMRFLWLKSTSEKPMRRQAKDCNSPCYRPGVAPCKTPGNAKNFPQSVQWGETLPIANKGGFVHQNDTRTKDSHPPFY